MGSSNPRRPMLVQAIAGTILGFLALQAAAKAVQDPRLKSSSVLIVDRSDSSIIYSRNSDVAMPIASITKLMTALVVLDAGHVERLFRPGLGAGDGICA